MSEKKIESRRAKMRLPVLLLLFAGQMFADPEIIPFEWSGQYGMMADNGVTVFQQDWNSGPVVIDGMYANYPLRFGDVYLNNFTFYKFGEIVGFEDVLPDSNTVSSAFDYRRGDYLYDQLEIKADFGSKNRLIRWNGFKRSYGGSYGQFNISSANPIQQSYRIDYISKSNNESIYTSAQRFITSSGFHIPDSATSGKLNDDISAAGIIYSHPFRNWNWKIHGSIFNQKNRVERSELHSTGNRYLSRLHFNTQLAQLNYNESRLHFGLSADIRHFRQDSVVKTQGMSLLYFGLKVDSLFARAGIDVESYHPELQVSYYPKFGMLNGIAEVKLNSRFKNAGDWKTNKSPVDRWLKSKLGAKVTMEKWRLSAFAVYTTCSLRNNLINFEGDMTSISPKHLSGEINSNWKIFNNWQVSGRWRHGLLSFISDGIGDKLHFSITGKESLFSGNMLAIAGLELEGWLNRERQFGFDPFENTFFHLSDDERTLPDAWLLNFTFTAEISGVTLEWSVKNVLNATEPAVRSVYPDIDSELFWVESSHLFLPMGRFMSFGVYWTFQD